MGQYASWFVAVTIFRIVALEAVALGFDNV